MSITRKNDKNLFIILEVKHFRDVEVGTPFLIMSSRKRLYTKGGAGLFLKCLLKQKYE
jgi:hypothetical protein